MQATPGSRLSCQSVTIGPACLSWVVRRLYCLGGANRLNNQLATDMKTKDFSMDPESAGEGENAHASRAPAELQLFRSELTDGRFRVFVRVLDPAGRGVGGARVVFVCGGQTDSVMTDDEGDAVFPDELLPPRTGEPLKVSAHVSGIRDRAIIEVSRRPERTPEQAVSCARRRQRARLLLVSAVAAWVLCGVLWTVFGFGNPLIDFAHHELTEQQKLYNDMPGVKGTFLEIKPVPSRGDWQKPLSLAVFLWTVFSFSYCLYACSWEAGEALRLRVARLIDQRHDTAISRDPLFKRLLRWSGQGSVVAGEAEAGTSPVAGGIGNASWISGEVFRSALLAGVTMEAIKAIARALRRR